MQKSPHRQEFGSPGTGSPNRGLNVRHFCVEWSQNGRQRLRCLAAESRRLGPRTGQSSGKPQGRASVLRGCPQCQTQEDPRSEIIALPPHLSGPLLGQCLPAGTDSYIRAGANAHRYAVPPLSPRPPGGKQALRKCGGLRVPLRFGACRRRCARSKIVLVSLGREHRRQRHLQYRVLLEPPR